MTALKRDVGGPFTMKHCSEWSYQHIPDVVQHVGRFFPGWSCEGLPNRGSWQNAPQRHDHVAVMSHTRLNLGKPCQAFFALWYARDASAASHLPADSPQTGPWARAPQRHIHGQARGSWQPGGVAGLAHTPQWSAPARAAPSSGSTSQTGTRGPAPDV